MKGRTESVPFSEGPVTNGQVDSGVLGAPQEARAEKLSGHVVTTETFVDPIGTVGGRQFPKLSQFGD